MGGKSNATAYYLGISEDYSEASQMAEAKTLPVPASQTSYTFTGLKPGTRYNVYIRYSYNGVSREYDGSVGNGYIYTLPGMVTGVNQTEWLHWGLKVTVKWDTQTGASGYEYIIKDEKNKKIKADTSSSYGGASCGIKNSMVYNIKVRAYADIEGTRYYGDWSPKAYLFGQPMIDEKSTRVSGGKLRVKWEKAKGVTSYDVYASTKEKTGYKKVGSYKKSKNSAVISKLKGKSFSAGKTYYVYIVGKKKVGKNTYTSGRFYSTQVKGSRCSLKRPF